MSEAGSFKANAGLHLPLRLSVAYLALGLTVLIVVLVRLHGGFSYSLDDGYIHLALAQQILHGHYGINPGEASSPSSSVLWPLLLAPFSRIPGHAWVPLAFNIVFSLWTCLLTGRLLERMGLFGRLRSGVALWVAAFAGVLCTNLVGLTFLGMEHTLQTLLVVGCAWGLFEAYEGRTVPAWVLWMAALAPAVRYEDLAYTLAVALACAFRGRWRAALLSFGGGLLPLVVFGLLLHLAGLPPLPSSVMVKGGVAGAHATGALQGLLQTARTNLTAVHDGQSRTFTPGLLVLAAGLWLARRHTHRRNALLCAAAAIALLYLFGPYGWFYRYDAAFRTFLLLICLLVLHGRGRVAAAISLLLVAGWVSFNMRPLLHTPDACTAIYRQQFQMHRFEHDYWRGSVAVDDLGWVSLDHAAEAYVLDLDGLASPEAAAAKHKDAAWLRSEVSRHGVGLAMIYTGKFEGIPAEWVHLGTLEQAPLPYGLLGGGQVEFYATSPENAVPLQRAADSFRQSLPEGVRLR